MILISAGHHAAAQGAQWEGNTEWQEAIHWRELLVHGLEQAGAPVAAVPSGLLRDKVSFINSRRPSIAMEVHFNSAVNSSGERVGEGCETLYYPGSARGKFVAEGIQSLLSLYFPPDRGAQAGWYRMDAPGRVDFHGDVDGDEKVDYFLRETTCPAIIIEPEFIHHIDLIRRNRDEVCTALVSGLLKALAGLDSWRRR